MTRSTAPTAKRRSLGRAEAGTSHSVATVERAADVLLHFVEVTGPTLGVTELATDLSMSKAAVHRILVALRTRNLVQFDAESRRYSLGPMAATLGLSYLERCDVRQMAAPELRLLSKKTNETATLSLRTGATRVYVEQVTPPREVIMSVTIGVPFPLHAGASSKAFLAFLDPAECDAYLARPLATLTENTVTNPDLLRDEISEVRRRGYARSSAERQPGAASVAAPVLDHRGEPCAVISVCGPAERLDREQDECIEELLSITRDLSRRMGYVSR